MTKPTITIGIPAHNEAKNIGYLIKQLISQDWSNLKLVQIIISSDGSTDKTISTIKDLNIKTIKIIDNHDRKGIARGFNQIIAKTNSDILITFDADIKIEDKDFVAKLIKPILDAEADLTSSSISEMNTKNKFEKILQTGMLLKENLFMSLPNKNNLYTCHGLARAYSKKLYKKIYFPVSVGNDMYSYLFCISHGMKYKYCSKANVKYRLPSNFEDHEKQSLRFFKSSEKQTHYFNKDIIKKETRIYTQTFIIGFFKSIPIIFNRFGYVVSYFFVQLFIRFKSLTANINDAWDLSHTSKELT